MTTTVLRQSVHFIGRLQKKNSRLKLPERLLATAEQLKNTLKGYIIGKCGIHSVKHLAGDWKLTLVSLSHHLQVLE